jgi:large subunit ribosomal protein L33
MAAKSKREKIMMKSTESSYRKTTIKNKQNSPDKLELNMYDPIVRRHVKFKEGKIDK